MREWREGREQRKERSEEEEKEGGWGRKGRKKWEDSGRTQCFIYGFSLPYSPPHLFRQLRYTQVALTQDTDSDAYTSYSHRLVYPPCKRFFIEPKAAASAIKCNITVIDSQRELCRLLVVPFAPKRGKREIFIDEELQERREEVE